MKKKLVIFIVLSLFAITGCTNKNIGPKSTYKITNNEVIIKVKESTLTKSSATVIMTNKTAEEYNYGEPYHLEVKEKNTWYILEPKEELYFIMPAYALKANESIEKEYNWEYAYGKLKSGTYRLVTELSTNQNQIYVAAEFTIK